MDLGLKVTTIPINNVVFYVKFLMIPDYFPDFAKYTMLIVKVNFDNCIFYITFGGTKIRKIVV
jgi:hypothetical protein